MFYWRKIIFKVILVLIFSLVIAPLKIGTTNAQSQNALLFFTPTSQSFLGTGSIGRNGSINAFLDPTGHQVASAELVITFNPSVLTVNDITPGAFFNSTFGQPLEIIKSIDNTAGKIHYALAFPLGSGYSSTTPNIAAVIDFTTIDIGTSYFLFTRSGTPSTKIADINAATVLITTSAGSVFVGDPAPPATSTPTNSPTPSPIPTNTSTPTPRPTSTSTPTPTLTPTLTLTPIPTATSTPTPNPSNTPTAVQTATPSPVPTGELSPTPTPGPLSYPGCIKSEGDWKSIGFATQTGSFEAQFDAIPKSLIPSPITHAYVGFASNNNDGFPDLAAIASFDPTRVILARNANKYTANKPMAYVLNNTYHFRFVVDISKHIYSMYVTQQGGGETLVASGFSFRTEQKDVTSLDTLAFYTKNKKKSLEICNLTILPFEGESDLEKNTDKLPRGKIQNKGSKQVVAPIPSITPSPAPIVPTTAPVPCTPTNGDTNRDGKADLSDYNTWLSHFNATTANGPTDGDFNCSNFVDGVDYVLWLNANSAGLSPSPIPVGEKEIDIGICNPENGQYSINIDNPYLPFSVGRIRVLEDDTEKLQTTVLSRTETVAGVETRVVEEREWINGALSEVTNNYYVQAADGTVCYYGEDVKDGLGNTLAGSWRAGLNGAKPGIMMPRVPEVDQTYYQEYAPNDGAMDRAKNVRFESNFTTSIRTFQNILYIEESPKSTKRYAPGVGLIYDDGLVLTSY